MAKVFYTDGTGNQQVLHESPNEKVPVYPTLSALEADLPNLSEGQLVAYEQGGDGLVDAVTNGDMRGVTSNAVYGATKKVTSGTVTQNNIGVTWFRIGKVVDLLVYSTASVSASAELYVIDANIPTPIQTFGIGGVPLTWGPFIVGYLYTTPPSKNVSIKIDTTSYFNLHHTYLTTDD